MTQRVIITWTSPTHSYTEVGQAPTVDEADKLITAVKEHFGEDYFGKMFTTAEDEGTSELPTTVEEVARWIKDEMEDGDDLFDL